MGEGVVHGRGPDPDRTRGCPDCGWQGPETALRGASAGDPLGASAGDPLGADDPLGAGDPPGADLACPRCGVPVSPEMPSVLEILATRRTPVNDGPGA